MTIGRSPKRGRPADMPGADSFEHGTRARYVTGCRCDLCRAANTRAYHDRQARARAAAAKASSSRTSGSTRPLQCTGVNRKPCPKGTRLYKNVTGTVCASCRASLVWNGLVNPGRTRKHLAKLSALGVGYKSVAAAADVGETTLSEVLTGRARRIRADIERRVLEVTAEAIADHAIVDGAKTWELIGELLARGLKRGEIAQRLGMQRAALQIGRDRVLARTAYAIAKLHRTVCPLTECRAAAAPAFCACTKPIVFELDAQHYCGNCDQLMRPHSIAPALERQELVKLARQTDYSNQLRANAQPD